MASSQLLLLLFTLSTLLGTKVTCRRLGTKKMFPTMESREYKSVGGSHRCNMPE